MTRPGRLEGKVALVTGAARGQGRAHAWRLAEDGADVIALDACAEFDTTSYPGATRADLEETIAGVVQRGRRAIGHVGDVREPTAIDEAVCRGVRDLGRLDVVVANAGIAEFVVSHEMTDHQWQQMIDINLTGVFNTVRACLPTLMEQGDGGSVILTSSSGGRKGIPNCVHYIAAKHGVVGLMRAFANEYGRYRIRFNSVHPTTVNTPLVQNEAVYRLLSPHLEQPNRETAAPVFARMNAMPVAWVEPEDVAHAVAWLASDEARYVTGAEIPVDAGFHGKV